MKRFLVLAFMPFLLGLRCRGICGEPLIDEYTNIYASTDMNPTNSGSELNVKIYISSESGDQETLRIDIKDHILNSKDSIIKVYSNRTKDTIALTLNHPSTVSLRYRYYLRKESCGDFEPSYREKIVLDTLYTTSVILHSRDVSYNVLGFSDLGDYGLSLQRFKGTDSVDGSYKLVKLLKVSSEYYFINLRDVPISNTTADYIAPDTSGYSDTVRISGKHALWVNLGSSGMDSLDYFVGIEPDEYYGDSIRFIVKVSYRGLRWIK